MCRPNRGGNCALPYGKRVILYPPRSRRWLKIAVVIVPRFGLEEAVLAIGITALRTVIFSIARLLVSLFFQSQGHRRLLYKDRLQPVMCGANL